MSASARTDSIGSDSLASTRRSDAEKVAILGNMILKYESMHGPDLAPARLRNDAFAAVMAEAVLRQRAFERQPLVSVDGGR